MAQLKKFRAGRVGVSQVPLYFVGLLILVLLFSPGAAHASGLAPEEVMVCYKGAEPDSVALAREYAKGRGIPPNNLLALFVPEGETISRENFDRFLAGPLRKELMKRISIKVLVLMYGLPLKVSPRALTFQENLRLKYLQRKRAGVKEERRKSDIAPSESDALLKDIEGELQGLDRSGESASVDSELTLARLEDFPLEGWLGNPLASRNAHQFLPQSTEEVLMVSRLDGPEPGMVRRMMADSLAVERGGLSGTACIDARWPKPKKQENLTGYAFYDLSLHRMAGLLRQLNWPVIFDDKKELFPEGLGLRTALYCGWYSLGHYVDTFVWQPGAVGYHIASSECETLKRKGSEVWCKRMIERGITATLGPVAEPYVQAFPLPEEFFDLLTGGLTLVESYFQSLPHLSWRMVLIGDPLYRPFGRQQSAAFVPSGHK